MVSLAQDAALDGLDPRQLKLLRCTLQPYSDTRHLNMQSVPLLRMFVAAYTACDGVPACPKVNNRTCQTLQGCCQSYAACC